jgi:hypothetical protein
LQDIEAGVGDPQVPYPCQMTLQRGRIVHHWTLIIASRCARSRDRIIRGAIIVRTNGGAVVNASSTFAFAPDESKRREVETKDKVTQETWEEHIEAVLLLTA